MQSRFFIFIIVLFLFWTTGHSQESSLNIDSILDLTYTQFTSDLEHSKSLYETAVDYIKPQKQEVKLAQLYHQLGVANHLLNNAEQSTDYFNKALLIFEKHDAFQKAGMTYAELGNSMKRRDTEKSLRYFRKGIKLLEQFESDRLYAAYDNYGALQHMIGNVDSAVYYFQKVLDARRISNDSVGIAYSLQKNAVVYSDLGEVSYSINFLEEALKISKLIGDSLLICESLTYYGDVYNADNQIENASHYYEKALKLANERDLRYLVKFIYSVLPDLYFKLGRTENAFTMLKQYSIMKDSILNEERVRSIAELELSFETTQKEQKIKLLEQDIKIKALGLKQTRRIGFAIAVVLLLLAALLVVFTNAQKLKHKAALLLQRENLQKERVKSVIVAEEAERERVARELHDGLGQLLSAAKMHVSSLEEEVDSELKPYLQNSIKLVDQACVEVREISHALLPKRLNEGALETALLELQEDISVGDKLQLELKIETDISEIRGQDAIAIYRIIQELVNNTIKHAQANLITLLIAKEKSKYVIHYTDNGKLFNKSMIQESNGIGWKNIFSRVEFIGGAIEIDSINGGFSATIKV